jgi:pyruvate dehydrogenase E1 component beta subunit
VTTPTRAGELTYLEALHEVLIEVMEADPSIVCLDVPPEPKAHRDVSTVMGAQRVLFPPVSEMALAGAGIGAALAGMKPIVTIGSASFMLNAAEQILNEASLQHYVSGGQTSVPVVFYAPNGAVASEGAQHALAAQAMVWNTPGLKLVLPASATDVQRLMKTAVADPDPVVVLDHTGLHHRREVVPARVDPLPFGVAAVRRDGADATVVATSSLVWDALDAADALEGQGIDVEVIDPRTLVPFDEETIVASVRKTGRLVVADETHRSCGAAAEIAARLGRTCFEDLVAPIERVSTPDVPVPFSPPLSAQIVPGADQIIEAVRSTVSYHASS